MSLPTLQTLPQRLLASQAVVVAQASPHTDRPRAPLWELTAEQVLLDELPPQTPGDAQRFLLDTGLSWGDLPPPRGPALYFLTTAPSGHLHYAGRALNAVVPLTARVSDLLDQGAEFAGSPKDYLALVRRGVADLEDFDTLERWAEEGRAAGNVPPLFRHGRAAALARLLRSSDPRVPVVARRVLAATPSNTRGYSEHDQRLAREALSRHGDPDPTTRYQQSLRATLARVRELIEGEDAHRPMDDQAIAEQLQRAGVQSTRRMVARCRKQLGFPSARARVR